MKLVLFDIDGTLLTASGAGRRALDQALREVYGTAGPIDSYDFRGGTDPQIVRDLLTLAGVGEQAIAAGEAALYRRYEALLEAEVGDGRGVSLYPGVRELVETLHARGDALVGLLTGNIEAGARIKLRPTGLWPRFRLGALRLGSRGPDPAPSRGRRAGRGAGGAVLQRSRHGDHRRHPAGHRLRQGVRRESHRGRHRVAHRRGPRRP